MALNFDTTKKIKGVRRSVKIFEDPSPSKNKPTENHQIKDGKPTDKKANDIHSLDLIENKPTENLLETTVKPTEEINGKSTENLRKTTESKKAVRKKPTDKPTDEATDDIRKTTVKPTDVNGLVGLQKIAFFALVKQAKELGFLDNNNGDRITPPINGGEFAVSVLNKTYKQSKDVLYELKVRGFIRQYAIKNGRGGFVQYAIGKELYQSCLLVEQMAKPTDDIRKTYGKPTDKPTDTPTETPLSSNSKLNIKENTNTEPDEIWFEVPEVLKAIGIGSRQVWSIVRQGFVSEEEARQSLEHFAYDVEKNLATKKTNNFFFGILRNKTPYTSQSYAQGEAKAIQEEIDRIKELQAQREELKELKIREEYEQYKIENPDFLDGLKKGNQFLSSSSPTVLEQVGFAEFKKMKGYAEENP